MLFYPEWSEIFDYVYYDEPSSTLFIKYICRGVKEYYKIERKFFYSNILPLLRSNKEFRNTLYWAVKKELAIKLDENIPDFELADLKRYSPRR